MDARPGGDPPVAHALARVLGLSSEAHLRADTPVAALGVDSLAVILLIDALDDSGWALDPGAARRATTVGDLIAACEPSGVST